MKGLYANLCAQLRAGMKGGGALPRSEGHLCLTLNWRGRERDNGRVLIQNLEREIEKKAMSMS